MNLKFGPLQWHIETPCPYTPGPLLLQIALCLSILAALRENRAAFLFEVIRTWSRSLSLSSSPRFRFPMVHSLISCLRPCHYTVVPLRLVKVLLLGLPNGVQVRLLLYPLVYSCPVFQFKIARGSLLRTINVTVSCHHLSWTYPPWELSTTT